MNQNGRRCTKAGAEPRRDGPASPGLKIGETDIMLEIHLNMYHAVALAAALYWLGSFLCEKVPAFRQVLHPRAARRRRLLRRGQHRALRDRHGLHLLRRHAAGRLHEHFLHDGRLHRQPPAAQARRQGRPALPDSRDCHNLRAERCSASSPSARSARTRGSASARARLR